MSTVLRYSLGVLLVLVGMLYLSDARAATCTMTTTNVSFGGYVPTSSTDNTSNGNLTLTCTPACTVLLLGLCVNLGDYDGVYATVTLSQGNSGTYASRSLRSGTNSIAYNLYTNSSYSTIFGNGSGGSGTVIYCFTGSVVASCAGATYTGNPAGGISLTNLLGVPQTQVIPVYGRIPTAQDAAVGSYTDTINVTVTY